MPENPSELDSRDLDESLLQAGLEILVSNLCDSTVVAELRYIEDPFTPLYIFKVSGMKPEDFLQQNGVFRLGNPENHLLLDIVRNHGYDVVLAWKPSPNET